MKENETETFTCIYERNEKTCDILREKLPNYKFYSQVLIVNSIRYQAPLPPEENL